VWIFEVPYSREPWIHIVEIRVLGNPKSESVKGLHGELLLIQCFIKASVKLIFYSFISSLLV
jgi:hypothetical protein